MKTPDAGGCAETRPRDNAGRRLRERASHTRLGPPETSRGGPADGVAERHIVPAEQVAGVDRLDVQEHRLGAENGTVRPRIMTTRIKSWNTTAAATARRSIPRGDASGRAWRLARADVGVGRSDGPGLGNG